MITATIKKNLAKTLEIRLPGNIPWLIVPILLFYLIFFGYPLLNLLWQSIYSGEISFSAYVRFFVDPVYQGIMLYTIKIGLVVAITSLVIAFPVAYFISTISRRWAIPMLAIILVPFWSSVLVRMYAWMVILGRNGVLNDLLQKLGITTESFAFLGTDYAVYLGLTYYLVPYMVLTLYGVMSNIDRRLLLAAQNLGASPAKAFLKIYVPLTKAGVIAGSFLVFTMAICMYITPALLGGPDQTTLPLIISVMVNEALDWQFASALAVILLTFMSIVMWLANKFTDLEKMWGGGVR